MKHLNVRVYLLLVAAAWCLLLSRTAMAQTKESPQEIPPPLRDAMEKYPGLLPEFGRMLQRIQREVQLPPERSESALLPLLPASTTYYVAFPNYGAAAHQTLEIFRDEMKQNEVLRHWWHDEVGKNGPQIEDAFENFATLAQYLGDEFVIAGSTKGHDAVPLALAAVRKPGLKAFLEHALKELPEKSRSDVRVLEPSQLTTAKGPGPGGLLLLTRPDLLVVAPNLQAAREFNAVLDAKAKEFATTPFGQRIALGYTGGVSSLAAANLQAILKDAAATDAKNAKALERSGFGDMQYLVWERKTAESRSLSDMELSFTGPRRRMASWLAAPGKLGSLEFVAPKAPLVLTVSLKNLGEVFDDVRDMARASDPNAFANVAAMEQAMHLSLKDDLLNLLTGEVTLEINGISDQQPDWNAVLRVQDADHLQRTFAQLASIASARTHDVTEDGTAYHSVVIPSKQKDTRIEYVFNDGYLVLGPTHESVAQRVNAHKTGQGLSGSSGFQAAIPPGHSSEASALLYEDAAAIIQMQMRRAPAEVAEKLAQMPKDPVPVSFFAYGEPAAIRAAGVSGGADVGAMLVIAAVAIPNLLRARVAANESAATGMLRTVMTAQVMYSTQYPKRGYARDLASLGPDPQNPQASTPQHASIIDQALGNANCTSGAWCVKSGYRFTMKAICVEQQCANFVAVGTPVSTNTGARNFCVTSDGLIRVQTAPPLTAPITASGCKTWPVLK